MDDDEMERIGQDPGALPGYHTAVSLDYGGPLDGLMLTREMLGLTGLEYDGDPEVVDEEGGFYDSP